MAGTFLKATNFMVKLYLGRDPRRLLGRDAAEKRRWVTPMLVGFCKVQNN